MQDTHLAAEGVAYGHRGAPQTVTLIYQSSSSWEILCTHAQPIHLDSSFDRSLGSEPPSKKGSFTNGVTMAFSRPGKPTDNAFIESFNESLRDECLNVHWFDDLTDAKEKLQAWRRDYIESRPHRFLDVLSPLEFKARWTERRSEIR